MRAFCSSFKYYANMLLITRCETKTELLLIKALNVAVVCLNGYNLVLRCTNLC